MRLYHSPISEPVSAGRIPMFWLLPMHPPGSAIKLRSVALASLILCLLVLTACVSPQATQALITVHLTADGQDFSIQIPAGSTVQQALDAARLTLKDLDRAEPAVYTVLGNDATVRVIRVTEKFDIKQEVLPFKQQTLRNESLPVEKEVLIQKGKNGIQETTFRRVYEDGVEISSAPVAIQSVTVQEPVPEIRMIGVQTPFSPVSIPGKLIYLRDGNVWVIEGTTGNRRAVLTTGDLDGRVFSLSTDGSTLLFTRRSTEEGQINSLWAAKIPVSSEASQDQELINLNVHNIVHFADFVPNNNTKIIFSTVEPRAAAPGWQANNDLQALTFSNTGWTTKWTTLIEPNSGGIYGWWGTNFAWAPDGLHLSYARPDGIGLINYKDGSTSTLLPITPLQTHRDWAWVPGMTWGPDGKVLYTTDHVAQTGAASPEESQLFDLTALLLESNSPLSLVSQAGMFSYPMASPMQKNASGEADYQIAYLQANFPTQSETSRYRLAVMDRDGSDNRILFPAEGIAGLEPQEFWGAWSPGAMPDSGNYNLAVLYQGNLWLVDVTTGETVQITGDGLTTRMIWK